ncbi:MAG: hypothetical protein VKJ06_08660 [Vampirovibrionales bacterium]|nr:hypothetical protein [Vampirovibrionales bacterium]
MLLNPKVATVIALATVFAANSLSAQAFEPSEEIMQHKGFSRETIRHTKMQQAQQEWREPPEAPYSRSGQLWENILNNDLTGSVDDFGRTRLRERVWWRTDE